MLWASLLTPDINLVILFIGLLFSLKLFFFMKIQLLIYILGKIWAPTSPVKICNQGKISEINLGQLLYAVNF